MNFTKIINEITMSLFLYITGRCLKVDLMMEIPPVTVYGVFFLEHVSINLKSFTWITSNSNKA